MNNQENLGKNIKEIFQDKYVIPLYQRNYAWREDEIVQLLQDIFVTFKRSKEAHYYIGSLVVLKRHNGTFEVIDGQQRLTTLSLIVRLLECYQHSVLSYDSRPAVEDFFDAFYKNPDSIDALSSPEIFYLKEAVHIIKETAISNGQEQVRLSSWEDKNTFADFLMNNVFLVRVEIPEDTDVASYFEIMNNRGEQLQKHEIVKALMMKKLELHQQKTFAKIWDTCSQMNVPIQKMFSDVEERKKIFGENYDSFMGIENLSDNNSQANEQSGTIDQILGKNNISAGIESNFSIEDSDKYHSIIDWSNFLMHILKLHDEENVQLNEKFLLDDYNELASKQAFEPWDFIKTLLYCRTVFDRFVVKQEYNPEKEDGFSWTLIKPKKHNNSQLDYESSFSVKDEPDNLIKALSMLQVSFRSRTYKNWLFELLKWFYIEKEMIRPDAVKASDLLSFLNYYIWNRYSDMKLSFQKAEQPINDKYNWEGTYCKGTGTPHFLFNFIDYLYWLKEDDNYKIENFDFKYWNSVEHHLAQNKAANIADAERYINNLGNLCLISKSSNSRLSDRLVQEKVEFYGSGNIGPKRQRMYAKTKNSNTWGEKEICDHYNEVYNLLKNAENILGVKTTSNASE